MPTGLPFQSMPAAQAGTPKLLGNLRTGREELVYPQQLGRMERDPNTGLMEPVYTEADYRRGPDPAGRPVVEMAPVPQRQEIPDPVTTLTEQSSAALEQALGMVKSKRRELQNSIRPAEESAWRDAQVDLRTINESNMDAEQKKQRIRQLQASYEKKVYGIRDGIRGDLDALTQTERQAKSEIELKRVTTQAKMEAIAGFGKKYGLTDEDVAREQLELLGVRLPQRTPAKGQTPVQRLRELNPVLQAYDKEAERYRLHPKTKRPQMLAPEGEWKGTYATEKDWRDVPETKIDEFWRLRRDYAALTGEAATLRRAVINRPGVDLLTAGRRAMSPIAQGVVQARAGVTRSAGPNDVSQLSDAELRRIAGIQ